MNMYNLIMCKQERDAAGFYCKQTLYGLNLGRLVHIYSDHYGSSQTPWCSSTIVSTVYAAAVIQCVYLCWSLLHRCSTLCSDSFSLIIWCHT